MYSIKNSPLVLRKFEISDVDGLLQFRNDQDIASGLGGFSTGYSRRDLEEWVEGHRRRSDEVLYSIVERSSGICIGHVGLYQIDHRTRKAVFGILIGLPEYHGRGFGRRITEFMVRFGFNELNLNKISLTVLSTNRKAIALYDRLGFVREGVSREEIWRNGKYHDLVSMSLLKSEWDDVGERSGD